MIFHSIQHIPHLLCIDGHFWGGGGRRFCISLVKKQPVLWSLHIYLSYTRKEVVTQFSMMPIQELRSIVIIQCNIWNISYFSYPLNRNAYTNIWVYIIHKTNILASLSIIVVIYLSIRRIQTMNIWLCSCKSW